MTIEELYKTNWIIFSGVVGSKAHGLATETSDTDIRGVYIQPSEDIIGLNYIPQISDDTNDTTFYELRRFLQLLSKGNPNVLELLGIPDKYILLKTLEWDMILEMQDRFLTMQLKETFTNYAYNQIKKAKGVNKKINWDKKKCERKTVLDFCHVVLKGEESIKYNLWYRNMAPIEKEIGISKVNNFKDVYSVYYLPNGGGGVVNIYGNESTALQLSNIPKDSKQLGYLHFDQDAWKSHCKDYRSYNTWLQERNESRYKTNLEHGKGYDSKNMAACFRLLSTSQDIARGKGLIVDRSSEREFLMSIRRGDYDFEELLEMAEIKIKEVREDFDNSNLPKEVDKKFLHTLIIEIQETHDFAF